MSIEAFETGCTYIHLNDLIENSTKRAKLAHVGNNPENALQSINIAEKYYKQAEGILIKYPSEKFRYILKSSRVIIDNARNFISQPIERSGVEARVQNE